MADVIARAKAEAEKADQEEAAEYARLEQAEKERQAQETTPPADQPPETEQEPTPESAPATTPPETTPEPNKQEEATARFQAELERLKKENEALQQKYRTAQGMLASKPSKPQDDTFKTLKDEIAQLKQLIAESTKPKERPELKYLTPEERAAMKEAGDLEPLELRQAKGLIEAERERLLQEQEAREQRLLEAIERKQAEKAAAEAERIASDAAFDKLLTNVDKLAPGFRKDNDTKGSNWAKFLDMTDPDTGTTYREQAERFAQIEYAKGIADLYKQYQAVDPSAVNKEALESQVKPGTSRAVQTPKPPPPKAEHTMAEYNAFYTDLRLGRLKPNADGKPRTPEQIKALQDELDDWYDREMAKTRR